MSISSNQVCHQKTSFVKDVCTARFKKENRSCSSWLFQENIVTREILTSTETVIKFLKLELKICKSFYEFLNILNSWSNYVLKVWARIGVVYLQC